MIYVHVHLNQIISLFPKILANLIDDVSYFFFKNLIMSLAIVSKLNEFLKTIILLTLVISFLCIALRTCAQQNLNSF